MQDINPEKFNPHVLTESLQDEIAHQMKLVRWEPVKVLSKVEYFLPDNPIVISPNPLIWEFDDYSPWFMRLHGYLGYWYEHIQARISEVQLFVDKSDTMVILKPDPIWFPGDRPSLEN